MIDENSYPSIGFFMNKSALSSSLNNVCTDSSRFVMWIIRGRKKILLPTVELNPCLVAASLLNYSYFCLSNLTV